MKHETALARLRSEVEYVLRDNERIAERIEGWMESLARDQKRRADNDRELASLTDSIRKLETVDEVAA